MNVESFPELIKKDGVVMLNDVDIYNRHMSKHHTNLSYQHRLSKLESDMCDIKSSLQLIIEKLSK
jgi:hypothetical protein